MVCSHCKQKGHEIATCFKIHGTPEWYEERLRARNVGRGDKGAPATSRAAGGSTHVAGTAGSGAVTASSAGGARANVVANGVFGGSEEGGNPLSSLTPEHIQALMNLVNFDPKADERMAGIE